jgi:hypothetical protein
MKDTEYHQVKVLSAFFEFYREVDIEREKFAH